MKSVVELEIDVPQARLAALFADPEQNTRWMDDIDRMEPVSGQPGMPGSRYRLVPKKGNMVFVATVLERSLPAESELRLEAPTVTVSVKGRFVPVSADRTRLTSEEVFTFKGMFNAVFGFFTRGAIRQAHRRHMEAFKRFAEDHK